MTTKLLFVDDDLDLLASLKRLLPRHWQTVTADSPKLALELLESQGPFAVIVSDMQMPGMNGIELLHRSKELSPDTVRILLTGHADLHTAIAAVNTGDVFRFLTKPCESAVLISTLHSALGQYQLVVAERELLEETLMGIVRVLSQILGLVNPAAQGRANRMRRFCKHIASVLRLPKPWQYEMAAILSQLGCLTIPPAVMASVLSGRPLSATEQQMVEQHPTTAAKLLLRIPRMEHIAGMVAEQNSARNDGSPPRELAASNAELLGAQILRLSGALDLLLTTGLAPGLALERLRRLGDIHPPELVAALSEFDFGIDNMVSLRVHARELNTNMVLEEDLFTVDGQLLATRGERLTEPLLAGIDNYSRSVGLREPVAVLVSLLDYEVPKG
ncbi:MAG: hypothetical protein BWK76_08895 [Desulfobulbaceae bacterium A2]|nr:MAG: hypothetical protein BWK76_08895 [Desulfobulbaceae bacterium A2]